MVRFFGCAPVAAMPTFRLAQMAESFTQKKQRVTLCRSAETEERELAFSRQVHHEKS
jgi:hypothetical protein